MEFTNQMLRPDQWRSQDVWIGVAGGGLQKYSLFQYKNVVDFKVLDFFSA